MGVNKVVGVEAKDLSHMVIPAGGLGDPDVRMVGIRTGVFDNEGAGGSGGANALLNVARVDAVGEVERVREVEGRTAPRRGQAPFQQFKGRATAQAQALPTARGPSASAVRQAIG